MTNIDDDLALMTRNELVEEVKKLRTGIRTHRDSSGHDLCWHHPELWSLLPEQMEPNVAAPPWPEFIHRCVIYRRSLDRECTSPEAGDDAEAQ